METYVVDKLFGGKLSGKRVAVPERLPVMYVPILNKPYFATIVDANTPVSVGYTELTYYRHRAVMQPDTQIIYFADTTDSKKAFGMLSRYMMRGFRKVTASP